MMNKQILITDLKNVMAGKEEKGEPIDKVAFVITQLEASDALTKGQIVKLLVEGELRFFAEKVNKNGYDTSEVSETIKEN